MTAPFLRFSSLFALVALLVLANAVGNLSPYLYLGVLVVAWPLLFADAGRREVMNRPESWAYLAAFLLIAIGFVGSADSVGDLENLGNFLPFLAFIPAVALLDTQARQGNVMTVSVLALAGAAVSVVSGVVDLQLLGHERAEGFFNLTNPFAMMAVMLGFLALMGVFASRDPRRHLLLAGPLLGAAAAGLAATRSAGLMIAALALVFLLFAVLRQRARTRLVILAAAVPVLALIGAAMALWSEELRFLAGADTLTTFFRDPAAVDISTRIRMELYHGGILAFLESPWVGYGWRDHVQAARVFMDPEISAYVALWSHLHNDYINFAAMLGLAGLAALLIYLAVPLLAALRAPRDGQYFPRLYGAAVLVCCYAIFGLFDTSFSAEMLLCFAPVFTAVLLGYCRDRPAQEAPLRAGPPVIEQTPR